MGLYRNGRFYAIHPDHLGTPRLITDDANQPVWQWPYSAFGANKPTGILKATAKPKQAFTNEPVLLKATKPGVTFNLRFPGQYFDEESNLSYNYLRSYQAAQGRYTQGDPIGLEGGLNRFGYGEQNPISFTDALGLYVKRCARSLGSKDSSSTTPGGINVLKHEFLNVSGKTLSFMPTGNMAWSKGSVLGNEYPNGSCEMVCNDDKFDSYVYAASKEIGAPTYCVWARDGTDAHALGARNCQTWVDDVLKLAKKKYLEKEECPTCFK